MEFLKYELINVTKGISAAGISTTESKLKVLEAAKKRLISNRFFCDVFKSLWEEGDELRIVVLDDNTDLEEYMRIKGCTNRRIHTAFRPVSGKAGPAFAP